MLGLWPADPLKPEPHSGTNTEFLMAKQAVEFDWSVQDANITFAQIE
jgi:hypothetical protein